jgi:hypothetical protein
MQARRVQFGPRVPVRNLGLGVRGRPEELRKAFLILRHAHGSARSLSEALPIVRVFGVRGKIPTGKTMRGALKGEEQDLLRAMLMMASSGLDAMVKQIVRDMLPAYCRADEAAAEELVKFAARRLRGDGDGMVSAETSKLLARVLAADSPQRALIDVYVNDLTKGSLQSVEQLHTVTAALGVDSSVIDGKTLEPVFRARNAIVHELDINFGSPRGNRTSRTMQDMVDFTNRLLELAERIYILCEDKVRGLRPTG